MYFAVEWSKEGLVGLLVAIEFVPPALVAYYGEGLHSFFIKDEAVVAIFVLWVFLWYYADVRVSRA